MNNEAPELSPEARRIISEARGFDDPTSEDRTRVKARWLASVAALAGVSSLTEAARAAGGVGWGLKAVGAAFALVAGAVGLYVTLPSEAAREPHAARPPAWTGETHERFQKASSAAREAAAPTRGDGPSGVVVAKPAISPAIASEPASGLAPLAPSVAMPAQQPEPSAPSAPVGAGVPGVPVVNVGGAPGPVASVEAVLPSTAAPEQAVPVASRPRAVVVRAVPVRATRGANPKAAPAVEKATEESAPRVVVEASPAEPGPNGQLSEELALLSQIRGSVQAGSPNRALELLANYEARFGRPIMGMEADALRVDALCRAGQRDAARASAQAFQIEWPGSPLGPRVSAACP